MTRARRAALLGGLAVAAYVAAAAAGIGPGVRPMLDGFAPVPEYRWIAPPPYFAPGNRPPEPAHASVTVRDGVSEARGVTTPDGQVVLTLGRGALEVPAGDRVVKVDIVPRAGSRRGLTPPLRPNGNRYRIRLTAEPSGTTVTTVARRGTLVLQVPELSTQLLHRDGPGPWTVVDSTPIPPRQLSLSAPFDRPGEYLSVTNLPLLAGPDGSSSAAVPVAIGVGAAVVLLALGGWWLGRRRGRVSSSAGTPDPDPAAPDPPIGS